MNQDDARLRAQLLVWWTIWGCILGGLVLIYVVLGRGPLAPDAVQRQSLTGMAGIVPLFLSIILRWLVLPRRKEPRSAFVLFVIGVALAETCGILGVFLGGPYRDELFVLGVLGIAQFVPFFARPLLDPRRERFTADGGS